MLVTPPSSKPVLFEELIPPVSVSVPLLLEIRTPFNGLSSVMAPPQVFGPPVLVSVPLLLPLRMPTPLRVSGSAATMIPPPMVSPLIAIVAPLST